MDSDMNLLKVGVDGIIEAYLPEETGPAKKVITAMNYAIKAGGKRIRPIIMYLTYKAVMFESDNVPENIQPEYKKDKGLYRFMTALELIHTSSLIHDDMPAIDNDMLRRGVPTVHAKFGEDTALLAGDMMLNYAYEIMSYAYDLALIERLEKENKDTVDLHSVYRDFANVSSAQKILMDKTGINGMLGGQSADVMLTHKKLTEEEIDFIYKKKTAALIEAAFMIGASFAGVRDIDALKSFQQTGRSLGLVFQVQDDILDIEGSEEELGKEIGQDDRNDKMTYVSYHGLEESKKFVKTETDKAIEYLEKAIKISNSDINCLSNDNVYLVALKNLMLSLVERIN